MKKKDLMMHLHGEGWVLVRKGKHEVWMKDDIHVAVPRSKEIAKYTAQQILKTIQKVKKAECS